MEETKEVQEIQYDAAPSADLAEEKPVDGEKTNDKKAGKKFYSRFNIKIAVIVALVAVVAGLAYYYKGLVVAATVNGSVISRFAVVQELEKLSGKNVLDSLITEKLINDDAAQKGISVSSDEVSAEIKKIEDQVAAQGVTLDQALEQQGMKREDFEKQMLIQKKIEKIIADKLEVTDSEADEFIKKSGVKVPAGQEADYKNKAKEQLRQQKLSSEAKAYVESLRARATINYYVNY